MIATSGGSWELFSTSRRFTRNEREPLSSYQLTLALVSQRYGMFLATINGIDRSRRGKMSLTAFMLQTLAAVPSAPWRTICGTLMVPRPPELVFNHERTSFPTSLIDRHMIG
jgi:hypothetical protein